MDYNKSIIEKLKTCPIFKEPEGWVIEYPQYVKLVDEQMHTFWPHDEPEVDNDVQDLRVRLTEQELHGLITTLKLFTLYEMVAGDDYWAGRFMNKFKRPEHQRMASMFSAVELNSHAPFYNKINELLHLDTEEFYSEWKVNPVLKERMKFIGKYVDHENELLSVGAFTFVEGSVLYSSFAFIKHFQSQDCGKDLITNICRGVNLSVGDENTHAIGGALAFRDMLEEAKLSEEEVSWLKGVFEQIAKQVYDHECGIIDMIYEKGNIVNLEKQSMKDFVAHRVNLCLQQLGFDKLFDEEKLDGFIQKWFYKNINSLQFHDFFSGGGSEYNINWQENKFGKVWETKV